MKYNIIFLDIDGVLNNHQFISRNLKAGINKNIDNSKVDFLKEIVMRTDAKIVLSSSWRTMFNDLLEPLSEEAFEIRSALREKGMEIWAKTDHGSHKANTIIAWIDKHADEINNYIVIDDDQTLIAKIGEPYLVKTSYYIGLSPKEVLSAIAKLNLPNEHNMSDRISITTDRAMLYDRKIYIVYLVLQGHKFNHQALRAVSKICNINYLGVKDKLLLTKNVIAEGNAFQIREIALRLQQYGVNFKIEPPFPYRLKENEITIGAFLRAMINFFPSTDHKYIKSVENHGEVLEVVIIEDIFMPEVIRLLRENQDIPLLRRVFDYFEEVSDCSNDYLINIFSVTTLEILGNDKRILETAGKYMGPKTRQLQIEADQGLGRL